MADRLLGSGTSGTGADAGSGAAHISQFTCAESGTLETIKVYCRANGNVRVAIYDDSGSDLPNNLLAESDSTAVTATAWRDVSLLSTPSLTQGTKYWLAMQLSANGVVAYRYASVKRSLQSMSYGAFPSTHTSGYSDTLLEYCLDGWGTIGSAEQTLIPGTIASVESFGTAKLALSISPSAISSAEDIPTPTVTTAFVIVPGTIASQEEVSTPTLMQEQFLLPSAIASAEYFPTPTVIRLLQEISPGTIASMEDIPIPLVVLMLQLISPPTIASAEAFGMPTLGYIGLIVPSSIVSAEDFPTPIVVRFTYHVILDGRFIQVSPAVNRVYVIGKDQYGNPVFGSSSDSDEISLVGERLDFQQELSIPTDDEAADVAAAMIAKRRLTGSSGFIIVPPNAGQELWDVIWIKDTPTAQVAQPYRVTGIRLEYFVKGTKPGL